MSMPDHEKYMGRALELARGVWGTTHPNPMVGAVIVENETIIGEGATEPDGGAHAERVALKACGGKSLDEATLYTTLEPCSTPGRPARRRSSPLESNEWLSARLIRLKGMRAEGWHC